MRPDNFRLIAEVAKRRSLWDTNVAMACRKDEFATQWACVADVMQLDVRTCKKRFKALRGSYRAEVRKIQQKRIGMSNWRYFRSLEFLRHIFDPEGLVPFPPEPEQCEDFELSGLDDLAIDVDGDSVDFEIIEDIFKRESLTQPLANKLPNSDPELSPRLLSPLNLPPNHASLPSPPPPSKRCRRRKTSSSSSGHQDTLKTTVVDDSDHSFLVSLMPHLKSLSDMNKLKFRMETSRLLMELNKEEMQPQDLSNSSYPYGENHNGSLASPSPSVYVDISMTECDIKVANEPLL